jgi:hypothetical protein
MHITVVVTNGGQEYSGILWEFRPHLNYLDLIVSGDRMRFDLRNLKSAVTLNERLSVSKVGDEDLLAKAKECVENWNEDGSPKRRE